MRIVPSLKFQGLPCSYVSIGCAYEEVYNRRFNEPMFTGFGKNGYLSLDRANKYIRCYFPIKKKVYYKKVERKPLKDFLKNNQERCIVCVLGHFIKCERKTHYS